MAQTRVYTCDLCKQSRSSSDLLCLEVKASNFEGISIVGLSRYDSLKIDICKDCLKKKKFVVELPNEKEEKELADKQNKKTLEDKIYEILEDMGVAFQE